MESQPQNSEFRINPENFQTNNELRACFMMAFFLCQNTVTHLYLAVFLFGAFWVKTKTAKYET